MYCIEVNGPVRARLSCVKFFQTETARRAGDDVWLEEGFSAAYVAEGDKAEMKGGPVYLKPGGYKINIECLEEKYEHACQNAYITGVFLKPLNPTPPVETVPTRTPTPAEACGRLCGDLWWDELNSMPDTEFISHLRAVLESGAKHPVGDYPYITPLEYAASYALHPEIFRLLLEYGADPNFYNDVSGPPLSKVASRAGRLASSRPAMNE